MRPRRQVAIFFLVLISFQIGGYYGVMEFLKQRLSERTAHRIATEQAPIGGQLVISIPVTSYVTEANLYEGSHHFTFEGNVYQVIGRHVYEDVLYVTCIHDDDVTDAQETIEGYAQSLAGKNGDQGTGIKFFENLTKYFCAEQYSWGIIAAGWTSNIEFALFESLYGFNQPVKLFHPPCLL